jgi:two-component system OmpR family response regulator
LKVLLVDDHHGFRLVAARLLTALGHAVVHTGDAESAMALFHAEGGGFDVVMMDLLLDNADGVALAERLEASVPDGIRVLFISGRDVGPADELSWLQAPHRRFLPKPFSAAALQSELEFLAADLTPPS